MRRYTLRTETTNRGIANKMSKDSIIQITSKIVEFTGNPATTQFIGEPVSKRVTEAGPVYAIGETGYVLTVAEFQMFARAGAIAKRVATLKTDKRLAAEEAERRAKAQAAKRKKQLAAYDDIAPLATEQKVRKSAPRAQVKAEQAVAASAVEELEALQSNKQQPKAQPITATPIIDAERANLLATSDFFSSYPKADNFVIEEPEVSAAAAKAMAVGEKLTGLFTKVSTRKTAKSAKK